MTSRASSARGSYPHCGSLGPAQLEQTFGQDFKIVRRTARTWAVLGVLGVLALAGALLWYLASRPSQTATRTAELLVRVSPPARLRAAR